MRRALFVGITGLSGIAFWLGAPDGEIRRTEASQHELAQVRDDSVDLTASVAWDFDAPPTEGFARDAGRRYLEDTFRQMASSTFIATEGRLQICKVFVTKRAYRKNENDIFIANEAGRAHAPFSGLRDRGSFISAFIGQGETAQREPSSLGKTLAHEFHHYALGLSDEYTEPEASPTRPALLEPSKPFHCDVTLNNTLMGSSRNGVSLSTPDTYKEAKFASWTGGDAGWSKIQKYSDCYELKAPPAGAPLAENAQWRTAQWRKHQRSAWETIAKDIPKEPLLAQPLSYKQLEQFASVRDGGVPKTLKLDGGQPFSSSCFQTIFLEPFVAFVVDRSASMKRLVVPATLETYFDRAKSRLKTLIASLPPQTTFTVIQYSNDVSTAIPPTAFDQNRIPEFWGTVDALQPTDGNTSLDEGLNLALDLIKKKVERASPEVVIAVTDGTAVVGNGTFEKYQRDGIPIFGQIGESSKRWDFSTRVTPLRGMAKTDQLLYSTIQTHLEKTPVRDTDERTTPKAQEPMESPHEVTELDGETTFEMSLSAEKDVGAFELVDPKGVTITPTSLPAGITYETDAQTMLYRVATPTIGVWKPRGVLSGIPTGNVHFNMLSKTSLAMTVSARGSGIYPEPWFVFAKLSAPTPIVKADVTAKRKRPARFPGEVVPEPTDVPFRDDGVAPDLYANDGIYTAVIATVTDDGDYVLDVRATNAGGLAVVDSAGVVDEPEPGMPARPLSPFTRTAKEKLAAQGFKPMPQSPSESPLHMRNDLTPAWVTINKPGDVVWLEFTGYAKGKYVAMTGGLISNDGQPMKTRLTLYDTDGVTVLGTSALEDGRASVDLDTGPTPEKKYFAKVEHTGGGLGRFQVAVAPRDWFVNRDLADAGNGGEDDCDCRAPGTRSRSTEPAELLLAGVVGVAAIRRWRRRRRKSSERD